jgi:hypothetical protein
MIIYMFTAKYGACEVMAFAPDYAQAFLSAAIRVGVFPWSFTETITNDSPAAGGNQKVIAEGAGSKGVLR